MSKLVIDGELLISRIDKLRIEKGISSLTQAYVDSGVGKDFSVNIINKGSMPSLEKIIKLSNFFNCSTDYLIGRTSFPNVLTEELEDFADLINDFLKLSDEGKNFISAMAKVYFEKMEKKNENGK